jgi:hypothetical protein
MFDCVSGANGNVVEEAKTHGPIRLGVMSRRADDGKGIACLTVHHGARAG